MSTTTLSRLQPSTGSQAAGWHVFKRLAPFTLVFAAACLMFFGDLGHYPLFNPDESLYAEPAREMLDTGEYITTLLNYVVRFTKPPLVIWAMALSYKVFGVNEFAARFLGAACGAILVGVTYLFAEKYLSRRAALIAAFSLLTAPLFIGTAREAITDMPLSLFIAGGLMAFFHGFMQKQGGWRWLGYVLVGLAVMTKGPVGLILPVGILGLYHLLRGELLQAWRYYKPLPGLAVIAAIAVPWFALEIWMTKGAYYQEFLVRENFQRFTSVVDHKGAWWYHVAVIAGGFFPWSLFAPQAIVAVKDCGLRGRQAAVPLFSAITFLSILIFFSVSVSKLLPYTVPGFPALALLLGWYLDNKISEGKRAAIAVPLFTITFAGAVALYLIPRLIVRLHDLPPALPDIIEGAICTLIAASAACGITVMRGRRQTALAFFAGMVMLCFLGFGKRALDVLSAEWEGPIPAFSQFAGLSHEPIIVYHMRKPSVTFYAGRQVVIPNGEADLKTTVDRTARAYIIGRTADEPLLEGLPHCRTLVKQGRYLLLSRNP